MLIFPLLAIAKRTYDAYKVTETVEWHNRETFPSSFELHQQTLPDIYWVLPDGYGRADILREIYDYDNGPFLRALQAKGFFVATRATCNYSTTALSVASILNGDYVGKLVSGDLDSFADWRIVRALVSNNRLGRFLKRQGYTTYSVSNQYYNVRWRSADHYVSEWWFLNQFEDTLLGRTPVPWLSRWLRTPLRYELHRRRNEYNLDATIRLVPEPGPKFVFVHLLSPHAPFVVGPEGEPRNPARPYSWVEGLLYQTSTITCGGDRQTTMSPSGGF